MKRLLSFLLVLAPPVQGAEQQFHGVIDLRLAHVDGLPSYLEGGYGKFAGGDGAGVALAQGALTWRLNLNESFGLYAIGSGNAREGSSAIGITEAYAQYRGLPTDAGLRWQGRAGLLYPKVSLENLQTAWTSPYTLDWSTQNAWIGEEVRHAGVELAVTRLGRFHGSDHDFSLGAALLRGNDPTGAMLAWHGWASSSRQSLYGETLPLPNTSIGFVPEESDPFIELDGRTGWHLHGEWDWRGRGRVLAGWYDNNADPKVVDANTQWAWRTRFAHLGVKWQLPAALELIVQYLEGDTLMRSPSSRNDLVFNDFRSAFVMLSRPFGPHRLSLRAEEFSVDDRDAMPMDDNDEYGKAFTVAWVHRLGRQWFLQGEYTRIDSDRPSRTTHGEPVKLAEEQLQFGIRFFF